MKRVSSVYRSFTNPSLWLLNGFIALPLIFSGDIISIEAIAKVILAILLFSVAAVIAEGQEQPLIVLLLLSTVLLLGLLIEPYVVLVAIAYIILRYCYILSLKAIPIVNIFTVAVGMVLRIYAGVVVLQLSLSPWIFVAVLCLALFAAGTKEQNQTFSVENRAINEQTLVIHDEYLLKGFVQMAAVCAIVFYTIFVLVSNLLLLFTLPLVIFGIYRYWYIFNKSSTYINEHVLYSDKPLLITILIWLVMSTCLII